MADDINIDLSNYKDRVGSRVLPGRYRVFVEDVEQDKSAAGNTMINLWLRVQGGEFDGATIVDRLVLTEKSLFRVVGFMQAIGMPTPKKRLRVSVRAFAGKVLDVDVDDGDPYNGRVKSEVRGYLKIAGGEQAGTPSDLEGGFDEFEPPSEDQAEDNKVKASEAVPDEVDLDKLDLG